MLNLLLSGSIVLFSSFDVLTGQDRHDAWSMGRIDQPMESDSIINGKEAIAYFEGHSGVHGTFHIKETGDIVADLDIKDLDLSICNDNSLEFRYDIGSKWEHDTLHDKYGDVECNEYFTGDIFNPYIRTGNVNAEHDEIMINGEFSDQYSLSHLNIESLSDKSIRFYCNSNGKPLFCSILRYELVSGSNAAHNWVQVGKSETDGADQSHFWFGGNQKAEEPGSDEVDKSEDDGADGAHFWFGGNQKVEESGSDGAHNWVQVGKSEEGGANSAHFWFGGNQKSEEEGSDAAHNWVQVGKLETDGADQSHFWFPVSKTEESGSDGAHNWVQVGKTEEDGSDAAHFWLGGNQKVSFQCPDLSGTTGICVNLCSSNNDCNNGQFCCQNGCGGRICVDPISA